MQQSPLIITDQVLGDNYGFNLAFPYDVNNWQITMTLKQKLTQTDSTADAQVQVIPTGVVQDDIAYYNVTLALLPGVTALLSARSYYFDIITKDTAGNIEHIISPESSVTFIPTVTQNP